MSRLRAAWRRLAAWWPTLYPDSRRIARLAAWRASDEPVDLAAWRNAYAGRPLFRLVPSEYGPLLPRTPALAEAGPELHHPRPHRRRDPQRALIAALYRQADMPVRLALIAAGWPPDGCPSTP